MLRSSEHSTWPLFNPEECQQPLKFESRPSLPPTAVVNHQYSASSASPLAGGGKTGADKVTDATDNDPLPREALPGGEETCPTPSACPQCQPPIVEGRVWGDSTLPVDGRVLSTSGPKGQPPIVGVISRSTILKMLENRLGLSKDRREISQKHRRDDHSGLERAREVLRKLDRYPLKAPTSKVRGAGGREV